MTPVDTDVCEMARSFADDAWVTAALCVQLVLAIIALLLAYTVVFRRKWKNKALHKNLKFMLANVVVSYCLASAPLFVLAIRTLFSFLTYSDPCELLSSAWFVIAIRSPFLLYVVVFPLWHIAIAIERSLATLKAHNYEAASAVYGIVYAVVVWSTSIFFVAYGIYIGSLDDAFNDHMPYVTITTKTNAQLIMLTHMVLLGLDLISSAIDFALIYANRRKMREVSPTRYSLSRSYQVSENIAVTVHLVLPLDVCNTLFFFVVIVLSTILRASRNSVSEHRYHCLYDWILTIFLTQVIVSLLIMMRYASRSSKPPVIIAQEDHRDLYLQQFRRQIKTD